MPLRAITPLRAFVARMLHAPPVPARAVVPGVALLAAYPLLSALVGQDEPGAAFVTAFVLALAIGLALRADGLARRLLAHLTPVEMVAVIAPLVLAPPALVVLMGEPIWCQRLQSLAYIVLGSLFLSDVLGRRDEMATLFWPWDEMRPHRPGLTRAMLIFYLGFLGLNEGMIRLLSPEGWLVFWAILPVLSHVVLSGLVLAVAGGPDEWHDKGPA